ncbi:MAG: nicotinate-nucleotide--dimethylbenzimidazole phosphoribosyltransferase, partial [Moraxellaceae bacterium]
MKQTWHIAPLDQTKKEEILERINQKTKPLGALGRLEEIALQIALIQNTQKISTNAIMMVFAADHGIADEGISIASSAVTTQMVLNF